MARPTKLTPDRALGIVELVRNGNYKKVAAAAHGVSERTLYDWIERGQGDIAAGRDTVFAQFAQSLARAEAESESSLVQSVLNAIPDDPKLALEILSRRYPARWARTTRPEDTTDDHRVEVVDVAGLTDDALQELATAAGLTDADARQG